MTDAPERLDPTHIPTGTPGIKRDPLPPPLWNPIAIGLWSLLLTPVFGATLQMLNWKALGDEANAKLSRYLLYGLSAYYLAIAVISVISPASSQATETGICSSFLLLLAWNMTAGKAQYLHVTNHFGDSYLRREWFAPVLIGIAVLVAVEQLTELLALALHGPSAPTSADPGP